MANDTILTPGGTQPALPVPQANTQYLERDKYLSEYETEGEKAVVRENLDVYAKESVYTQQETNTKIGESIKAAFDRFLNLEDPHGILPQVQELIRGSVKDDGSTPFTAPQRGVDPIQDYHLATKRFVTSVLRDHLADKDPHEILPLVEDMLVLYVKQSEVYFKSQLYTKNEVDRLLGGFLKKDGSTPFTIAQIGADPQIDSHLTTKRYVDSKIYEHLVEVDPHGFIQLLNNRLASYAKALNVYDKSQTYSRVQIDSIIRSLVRDAALEALQDHLNAHDPHNILAEVRAEKYVKQDGSTPFKNPLKGVDAIDPQDLVTYHQVSESIQEVRESISQLPEPIWITSGPVESTVGHVEDNTPMPSQMTLQEVCDAIFYGKGICLEVPEYVIISDKCPVTMCVHGSTGLIEYGQLFQNGELIYTLQKEDFENGCLTVDSLPLYEDAEFTFKVIYTNGSVHEETKIVDCHLPFFVGLLPKWKFGNSITMDYLIQLCREDLNNNAFLNQHGKDATSVTFKYNFLDPALRHPMVVIPANYPNLDQMVTKSQSFGLEAFNVIDAIPLRVPGIAEDVIFKIYIYKQALSSLNQDVTFNFIPITG